MNKESEFGKLVDDTLDIVNGGAKSLIEEDEGKTISGGMKIEIEGEETILFNDGANGFKCMVNGKEYRFSNAEIEEMLRQQLGK